VSLDTAGRKTRLTEQCYSRRWLGEGTGLETRRRDSERATGLEPATSSLGSWHSTTELRPRDRRNVARRLGEVKAALPSRSLLPSFPPSAYLDPDASRKLRKSGSLMAGSPGETLSSRPCRIHRSNSPTRSNRWSNESTMNSSGW
jgi:hypothetical protein